MTTKREEEEEEGKKIIIIIIIILIIIIKNHWSNLSVTRFQGHVIQDHQAQGQEKKKRGKRR